MSESALRIDYSESGVDPFGFYTVVGDRLRDYIWLDEYPQFAGATAEQIRDFSYTVLDETKQRYVLHWKSLGLEIDTDEIKPRWRTERMFFMSRTDYVEVKTVQELYFYGNQCLYEPPSKKELDKFGRNHIDKLFIRMCEILYGVFSSVKYGGTLTSLSCKKEGDRYIVHLQSGWRSFERELNTEMIDLIVSWSLNNNR